MHPGVNSGHNVRSLPAGLWCLVKIFFFLTMQWFCMNAIICMNLTKPVKNMAFLFVIKYSQSFWQVSWDSSIYCAVCYYDCRKIQDLACWEQKQRGVQCLSEQITSHPVSERGWKANWSLKMRLYWHNTHHYKMQMNNSSHFIGCSQQRWAWPRGTCRSKYSDTQRPLRAQSTLREKKKS